MADIANLYDDRITGILEGAKRAFAEKGFDGASMQDLARAAGMSAGNFYRYFPSKDAIVEAMIDRDLADVQRDFEIIQTSEDPASALLETFRHRLDNLECEKGPLWAEIDAAARRRPQVAAVVSKMETEISLFLITVFARMSGLGLTEARARFSGHCIFLIMVFKGASQRLSGAGCRMSDETRSHLRGLVLQTIEQTLTEISALQGATDKELAL
jgi:AcrR family transcriptional regulator